MKFSEFLINEDDLTRGMAKTRQAIGAKGPIARAGTALQKAASGERVMGTQAQAIQPYIQSLQKILANPMLAGKFKQLAAMAEKQDAANQQQAGQAGGAVPGQGAEQVGAATR